MRTTVTVTSRGLVTLPAKLRQALGLKPGEVLIAEATPDGLLLRPAVTLFSRSTPISESVSLTRRRPSWPVSRPDGGSSGSRR